MELKTQTALLKSTFCVMILSYYKHCLRFECFIYWMPVQWVLKLDIIISQGTKPLWFTHLDYSIHFIPSGLQAYLECIKMAEIFTQIWGHEKNLKSCFEHQHLYMSTIHNCNHLPSLYYVPRTVLKSILRFYVIFTTTLSGNAVAFTVQVRKLS